MAQPHGFSYRERSDGSVVILHNGHQAAVLRRARAAQFLREVSGDPQQVMARWTGNYKRGNERQSKSHPRNRGRSG